MSEIDDGGPAFPLPLAVSVAGDLYDASQTDPGMSLRDYLAAAALTGLVIRCADETMRPYAGQTAYAIADDALKARKP